MRTTCYLTTENQLTFKDTAEKQAQEEMNPSSTPSPSLYDQ